MSRTTARDLRERASRHLRGRPNGAFRARFRKGASHVADNALHEPQERVLNLETTRGVDRGAVAFRHTQAVVHLIVVRLHLDVYDLDANGCQGADERVEDPTFGGKPKLDERQRSARAVDKRDQRLGEH